MAQHWIKFDELHNLSGWRSRTAQLKAKAGKIKWRSTDEKSRNGKQVREFLVESLDSALQSKFFRSSSSDGPNDGQPNAPGAKLILFGNAPAAVDKALVALPDPEAQRQAEERFQAISPLLDYLRCASAAERECWCVQNDFRVRNSNELARLLGSKVGRSGSAIWNWKALYLEGGFTALADRVRADKGVSRFFERNPKARMFAAYLYLIERMTASHVHEQIEYERERLELAGELPSYETVRVFLSQEISPAMRTYAREGQRAYRERMAPYLKRGYADVFANECWVGDHAIHDVEGQNDIFEDLPLCAPGLLRMSAFIDYRSRKAWATWAPEGSSRSIAATLVRAILEVGPPEHIYVDNGRDYRKVAKGAAKASSLSDDGEAPPTWWENEYSAIEHTGLLGRLGIAVTHCIPRHPQSKHVERFFRTMHERFDAMYSTYTSGSPATRPDRTEGLMMRHRWLLKHGRVEESQHPPFSQIIRECLAWIEEYNNTPHSGQGMDGRTPNEVFLAERNPRQKPIPDPDKLALLLMDYKRVKVRECSVTITKRRYMPRAEDRMAWAAMHEANETEVVVGHNATDPEFAVALGADGRLLAWLECEAMLKFAPWDAETQRQIGESMEIRRGLEKATRKSLAVIASAARAEGAKSKHELLQSRLQSAAGVDAAITKPKPRLAAPKVAAPMTPDEVAHMILEESEQELLCQRSELSAGLESVTTQRAPRIRPDKAAHAPPTACEIARDILKEMNMEKAG